MGSIFGLLNKKKKFEDTPDSFSENLENRTIVLDLKKDKKDMTDQERALKVPNQNSDLHTAAPLPDISKLADKIGSSPIQMKTFDILVYEMGDNGTTTQKKVDGVKASSAQELMMLYGAEGAKIKILREYDEGGQSIPQPGMPPNVPQPQIAPPGYPQVSPQFLGYQAYVQQQKEAKKEPPKFFEIGGVKCKLEDGKMYQEQWMKVDSSKYRLIADSTNKIVSMDGKHLEMLKWVQIENDEGENANA